MVRHLRTQENNAPDVSIFASSDILLSPLNELTRGSTFKIQIISLNDMSIYRISPTTLLSMSHVHEIAFFCTTGVRWYLDDILKFVINQRQ